MVDPDRAIRSIAIVGGGIVALSAALALRQALPQVAVTLVETPPDSAALADRLTTAWPSINRFHSAIGLTEAQLIASGAGMPLLGIRFDDPASGTPPFFLVHGQYGVPIGSVPFHEIWARAWRAGRARPYSEYSTAAVLAGAGRFVHPEVNPESPLSTYDYGWRLDAGRYLTLLSILADRMRTRRINGVVGGITRRFDGGIASVQLSDGRDVVADLFIECTGPAAPLSQLLELPFTDWGAYLQADRVLIADQAPSCVGSCDAVTATQLGWRTEACLSDRSMLGIAVRAGHEHAAVTLLDGHAPETVRLRPGCRDPWRHNLLAIGDAAIAVGPVPGVHLHLAHLAIGRAIELMPGRDCHISEIDEYRRRAAREGARLRNFLKLFEQNPRPECLDELTDQFVRRGRFISYDDDAIPDEMWIAALIGRGFIPQATSTLCQAIDPTQADALLTELCVGLATLPSQLPSYRDYLATAARR